MTKLLSGLGVIMLALLLFVGLVHLFLKVQHKDSPETLASLHDLPVIGGFFVAPPPAVPEPSPEEKRDSQVRQDLIDSREFFPLPEGFDRKGLDELVSGLKDAFTTYEQGLQALEKDREDLARVRAEVQAEKDALEAAAKDLAERALDLQKGREELDLRANRMAAEELKNLKASTAMYEQMAAEEAAAILGALDVDTVAKVLKGMSPRKSGRILAAMKTPVAVEVTRRLQAITTVGEKTAETVSGETPAGAGGR